MTNRSEAWLDIGNISPDDGEDLHVAQLQAQRIDAVTDKKSKARRRRSRRRGRGQSFESDRDYTDINAAIPGGFAEDTQETVIQPELPLGLGKIAARQAAQAADRAYKEQYPR